MIEHLFMLRCLLFGQPGTLFYVQREFLDSDAIQHYVLDLEEVVRGLLRVQLPFEAASLKDTPDVIQMEGGKV